MTRHITHAAGARALCVRRALTPFFGLALALATACQPVTFDLRRIALDAGAPSSARAESAYASASLDESGCGPSRWSEPPDGIRRSCGPELAGCIESGADEGECQAEQPPECDACLRDAYFACATANGCAVPLGALECCLRPRCPEGEAACVALLVAPGAPCQHASEELGACASATAAAGGPCERYSDACWSVLPPRLCYGEARATGRVHGAELHVRWALAFAHEGALHVLLAPGSLESVRMGQRLPLVRLHPVEGMRSYAPRSGLVRCAIVEREIGGWAPVEELYCELELDELTHASSAGVCDGRIRGAFRAMSGSEVIAGSFEAPLRVARGELGGPGCSPANASCEGDGECCSGACSPHLHVCF